MSPLILHQDIKILGWYPAGPVFPDMEKVPLLALARYPSSDDV